MYGQSLNSDEISIGLAGTRNIYHNLLYSEIINRIHLSRMLQQSNRMGWLHNISSLLIQKIQLEYCLTDSYEYLLIYASCNNPRKLDKEIYKELIKIGQRKLDSESINQNVNEYISSLNKIISSPAKFTNLYSDLYFKGIDFLPLLVKEHHSYKLEEFVPININNFTKTCLITLTDNRETQNK